MRTTGPLKTRGFTLIEVLMAIAIIGILAGVAYPSYVDYIRRAKITEATAGLAGMRVQMEQYFQDNRTYAGFPCPAPTPGPKYFTFTCESLTATTYTIVAQGNAGSSMDGFIYRVNQVNAQSSEMTDGAAAAGFVTNANCWVVRKGDGANAC